jgi:hypothetical protein
VRFLIQPILARGPPCKSAMAFVLCALASRSDVGRTPAIDVSTSDTTYIIDAPEAAGRKARSFVPQFNKSRTIVSTAPNSGIVPHSEIRILTTDEWNDFQDLDRLAIYIVGAVQYRDLFSSFNSPFYETDYCYRMVPKGLIFGSCDWDTGFRGQMK